MARTRTRHKRQLPRMFHSFNVASSSAAKFSDNADASNEYVSNRIFFCNTYRKQVILLGK